nr:hypothetical protein [Pseudonocardia sp. AL041005-10]
MTDTDTGTPTDTAALDAARDRIRSAHLKPAGSGRPRPPAACTTPPW